MKIKVLGSGSDGNCYVLSDSETTILIECGLPMKVLAEGINYDYTKISGVLISHCHLDHALICKEISNRVSKVYLTGDTQSKYKLYDFCSEVLQDGKQFEIGTLIIMPFRLKHLNVDNSDCENYGFVIYSKTTKEKLLYATDFMYIGNRFNALDYIMIEVNYQNDVKSESAIESVEKRRLMSHASIDTVIDFLNANDLSKVKKIVALHLSQDRTDKETVLKALRRATGKSIVIAEPGTEV